MLEILKKMNPLYMESDKNAKTFNPSMSDTKSVKSVTIKAEEPQVRKASPFRESITSQFNAFNASKKVRNTQSGTLRPKTGVTRNERPSTMKSTSSISKFGRG